MKVASLILGALLPILGLFSSCSPTSNDHSGGVGTQAEMERLVVSVKNGLDQHRQVYATGNHSGARASLIRAEQDCSKALTLAKSLKASDPARAESISLTRSVLNDIRSLNAERY